MGMTATITSSGYRFVLLLHILSAIVGFGGVFLNVIYGNEVRKRKGPEGLAIFQANFKVANIAEYFIYAVPIFGLALVGMSDKAIDFGDTWVWLALVLYVVALGVVHGLLRPRLRRMEALMVELNAGGPPGAGGPPPQAVALEQNGKEVAMISGVLNLMLIVLLYLMIFKPGGLRF